MKTLNPAFAICAVAAWSGGTGLRAEDHQFTRVKLPLGLSTEMPGSWWTLRGAHIEMIKNGGQAIADLAKPEIPAAGLGALLFQPIAPPKTAYPMIYVTLGASSVSAAYLKSDGAAAVKENGPKLREWTKKTLAEKGNTVESFSPVELVVINGCHGIGYSYVISAPEGALRVDNLTMIPGDKQLVITMTSKVSEDERWLPIMKHIRSSFAFEKP